MKYWRPLRAAFLFTLALVALVVAFSVLTIGDLDVFEVVLWTLIGGWAAVVLIRSFQVAILATPTDVTIRNWLATKRMPWTDVARVSPPPAYGALRSTGIRFELTSGKTVSAAAFARGPFDGEDFAGKVVADLEGLRTANGPAS